MGIAELIAFAVILLIVLNFILWIAAIVDVARSQFVDSNTKLVWFLIILFLYGLGAILYFLFARKRRITPNYQS
ncbi:MAG: PLDc N-terminal domain-containing protein [Phycisphaeraceae bacterium JB051]